MSGSSRHSSGRPSSSGRYGVGNGAVYERDVRPDARRSRLLARAWHGDRRCAVDGVAALFALACGQGCIAPGDVVAVLGGEDVPGATLLVRDLRLPRALLALVAGCCFGLGGAAFQLMLRNPLREPRYHRDQFRRPDGRGLRHCRLGPNGRGCLPDGRPFRARRGGCDLGIVFGGRGRRDTTDPQRN
ncbi:iron chelate uptake ABC transporter family permease subunit [Palleronia aestuarii]|uniref:iron chelate uptake ABC transporter family permease subunit n=1 Tax=Palleronia aestuarii TaxID=568105 RepID=UPI000DAB682C